MSCSATTSRSPTTPSATPPATPWTTCRTATSPCWRTSGSTRARPARTTRCAARSPTSWRRSPTSSSATASAWCTASRPPCTTSRSGCRTPWAGWWPTEIDVLRRLTEDPERPYVVVLGGSKVSDKLGVIDNLLGKADRLLIGGGMVFTFLKAQGHEVGSSLLEEDQVDTCRSYLQRGRGDRGADPAADRRGRRPRVRRRRRAHRGRRPTRSPPTRSGSTSGRTPAASSRPRCPTRRRCSGTARWASSSSRRSPAAPVPSPRR